MTRWVIPPLLLLAISFALHAQSNPAQERLARLAKELRIEDSVVYKTVDGRDLQLLIILPKVQKYPRSPVMVFFHGGGWTKGNRYALATFADEVRALTAQGIACVSADYRLLGDGRTTVYESAIDCRDVLHFLSREADRWHLDPDRIALFGTSAGGHLSLVTALGAEADYPGDPALASHPFKIRGVVSYFGPVSLDDPSFWKNRADHEGNTQRLLGGPIEEKREIARLLSPLGLLTSSSPPILAVHGDQDRTVDVSHSLALAEKGRQLGTPVQCIVVKGEAHGLSGKNVQPPWPETRRATVDFLLRALTPEPATARPN